MTKNELERMKRIAQMDFIWDESNPYVDLTSVLDTLRKEGLYSAHTNERDSIWAIQRYIEYIRLLVKELCRRRRPRIKTVRESN